ncbi:MAG: hypothetical protein M1470_06985 [Bacteroidetes bacterium]|nr:hypothetical protein [Bacteroidota bacterium]
MARAINTKRVDKRRKSRTVVEMPLKPINYIIIAAGALLIIVTYIILATNDTVYGFIPLDLVPILLFIGYIVVVPIGIMYRGKKKQPEQNQIPVK